MFGFRRTLMLGLLGCAALTAPALAQDLQPLPMGSACEAPAADYKGKIGMMQSVALPVMPVKASIGTGELEFQVVSSQPDMHYPTFVVHDIAPADAKKVAGHAKKNGAWAMVMMYDAPGETVDPSTSDYQVQLFVEVRAGGKMGCVGIYDENQPVIISHADLPADVLGF